MVKVFILVERDYISSHHAQQGLEAMLDKVPGEWEAKDWGIRK